MFGKGWGIATFSEEAELSRGEGEGRVNNEPVEISWRLEPGKEKF